MIILMAHNTYQQPGGEDRVFSAEAELLTSRGDRVVHFLRDNDAIRGMGRLSMARAAIWNRDGADDFRALIRRERPDVVHFHNTFPLISPAAYHAARAEGVAVVQTLHNYRLLCPNALFFRDGRVCEDCLGRSIPWPAVVHKCYRGSRSATATVAAMLMVHRAMGTWWEAVDVYIALTEFCRRKFVEGGLPAEKIVVKPNFIATDPGVGGGRGGYSVFVGRLASEKGLETLLKAWKALDGKVPLKVVGDGPMAAAVQGSEAKDAGVDWLGHRSAQEVYSLIGEAMFLVFPSECYETFGRVGIEAFAKGTPVIASRLGAMAELVDHGRTGLHFEPGEAGDLVSKIRRLLADPRELSQMRQAARREFERRYTAESNYRILIAIYERALGGGPSRVGRGGGVGTSWANLDGGGVVTSP